MSRKKAQQLFASSLLLLYLPVRIQLAPWWNTSIVKREATNVNRYTPERRCGDHADVHVVVCFRLRSSQRQASAKADLNSFK
jgi:hypothetical protein